VEDDEGGWITPDNFGTLEHPLLAGDVEEEVEVACITADYAMQNVLLQMGLQVLSIDGLLIREVRTFVLRCIACFKVTRDMDRLFCPSCGNHSLRKVAYVVDAQGAPVLLLSNRPPSIRGTKYSIPQHKGGRHQPDMILREDQLPIQRRRRQEDILDPDHLFLAPRKAMSKSPVVGPGRRNPNQSKRRTGKRKKNRGTLN